MRDAKIKWRTSGTKTDIACFEVGNYYTVQEMDKDTGEITKIGETFSLVEAWGMYHDTLDARMRKVLWEQDKARRPENSKKALLTRQGLGHVTDLQDPFMRQLLDDYCAGKRIPVGDALSEDQRREFDRMVIAFLVPDLPKAILNTMK